MFSLPIPSTDAQICKRIMIFCETEIYDRMLSVYSQRQLVTFLVFKRISTNEIYLYLYTWHNKQRYQPYQIVNNIERVNVITDSKFKYTKLTIRLKQPCHDLIIKSDMRKKLYIFLFTLERIHCTVRNFGYSHDCMRIIDKTAFTSDVTFKFKSNGFSLGEMKAKIVVKKKSEYRTLQGFPSTTEQLILRRLNIKSFNRQILYLQSLRILDLSNNEISYLPKEMGTLPHLQQLILSRNNLGNTLGSEWTWLEQTAIKHNLLFLDISSNSLTELPKQIRNLNALTHLKVAKNRLTCLPHNIKFLQNLRVLDVARNRLFYLPVTIIDLRLHVLDVTKNPFTGDCEDYIHDEPENITMPNLVELSARSILKSRIIYDTNIIPNILIKYLDEAKWCQTCKTALFDCYVRKFIDNVSLHRFVGRIKHLSDDVLCESYFCSSLCLRKFRDIFYITLKNDNVFYTPCWRKFYKI